MCDNNRPSVKAVFDNMKKPMPFIRKIGFIIKNNWLKLIRIKNCCGNTGEPGC